MILPALENHDKANPMKIFYNPDHIHHAPERELHRGAFVPSHEGPHRANMLLGGLTKHGYEVGTGSVDAMDAILEVHSRRYVGFLQNAWQQWQDAGYSGDVLPMTYPHRARRADPPNDIDGAAGYYAASADCPLTKTSWKGIKAAADCTLAAVQHVQKNQGAALALTRPPGHHAGREYMAGYCYLNYAAIAAQYMRDNGAAKVAILDVDFHHGNGTQDIFYARDDVFFASLHGEPDHHFPYFWGHKDETGEGAGEAFTANYPLPAGTQYAAWKAALMSALEHIKTFAPDALIVSLGVDTFENDPISSFKLKTPDYADYSREIAALDVPTCLIMEGGYGVPEIGDNVAGVLDGFE